MPANNVFDGPIAIGMMNEELTRQENSIVQPKTDKWFGFPSHFSSFFTV